MSFYSNNFSSRNQETDFESKLIVQGAFSLRNPKCKLPEQLTVYGDSRFQFCSTFPREMTLQGDVVVTECQDVGCFGANTTISADLSFTFSGAIELHRGLSVGGTLRSKETVLLIPEEVCINLVTLDPKLQYILLNKNSTLQSVLDDFSALDIPGRINKSVIREDIRNIFKRRHRSVMDRLFIGSSKTEQRWSDKPADRAQCSIIARRASRLTLLQAFSHDLRITGPNWTTLSESIVSQKAVIIEDCPNLTTLPSSIFANSIRIKNCPALKTLPESLECITLTIEKCESLKFFRANYVTLVNATIQDCVSLSKFVGLTFHDNVEITCDKPLYTKAWHVPKVKNDERLAFDLTHCMQLLLQGIDNLSLLPKILSQLTKLQQIDESSLQFEPEQLKRVFQQFRDDELCPELIRRIDQQNATLLDRVNEYIKTTSQTNTTPAKPEKLTIHTILKGLKSKKDFESAFKKVKSVDELDTNMLLELMVTTPSSLQRQFLKELIQESHSLQLSKPNLVI